MIFFFGVNLLCVLSGEVLLKTYPSIRPYVKGNDKNLAKLQKFKFHNSLNGFYRGTPLEYG